MSTLFLEAFGQLSGPPTIDCEEEDLYSVFLTRSELMGWGAPSSTERPLLWHMEEAEITADSDSDRIGFVQVGLGVGPLEPMELPPQPRQGWSYSALGINRKSTDPVLALPPLVQCFHDSLSRFGDVELTGLQLAAMRLDIDAARQLGNLVSMLNWFNTNLKERADALVSFDRNLLGDHEVSELVAGLQWRNTGSFEFRSVVDVPEQHMVKMAAEEPSWLDRRDGLVLGISVTMPEWTPSAAGWVLASTIDAARAIEPAPGSLAVRITRLTPAPETPAQSPLPQG